MTHSHGSATSCTLADPAPTEPVSAIGKNALCRDCGRENSDFGAVRGVKTSHAVAGGFPEPLTEGPGRAPYCSVTPGYGCLWRDAVPTSLDTFNFQYRIDFPGPFRPSDAAHNHSALDFACLAVRAVVLTGT